MYICMYFIYSVTKSPRFAVVSIAVVVNMMKDKKQVASVKRSSLLVIQKYSVSILCF